MFACFAYVYILKREAVRSSVKMVTFYRATQRHMVHDSTPHSHSRENLESHVLELRWSSSTMFLCNLKIQYRIKNH